MNDIRIKGITLREADTCSRRICECGTIGSNGIEFLTHKYSKPNLCIPNSIKFN